MIILMIFVAAKFMAIVFNFGQATPSNTIFSKRTYKHRSLQSRPRIA